MYFPIFRTQSQKCSHIAHIIARTRHNHLEFIKLEAYFPEVPLQQPLRPGGEFLKKEKFYLSFPQKSAMQLFCPPQYTKNCCVHSLAFVGLLRMLQSFTIFYEKPILTLKEISKIYFGHFTHSKFTRTSQHMRSRCFIDAIVLLFNCGNIVPGYFWRATPTRLLKIYWLIFLDFYLLLANGKWYLST